MINYEKKETTNDVTLQGKIVYKFSTPKVTILTLTTGNATSIPNYPKVVFFGDLKNRADQFENGDFVTITGNIQSSKRKPGVKNQVMVSIFGESIDAAKSVMKETFDIEGNYIPYENKFNLSGKVVGTELVTSDIFNITIETRKNGRLSFVKLTKFLKTENDSVTNISAGDHVYVLGHVQTHKSKAKDDTKHFQNYIISEIRK